MKNHPCFSYTLLIWSESELLNLNPLIAVWIDKFATYGGVPRHVFWNGIDQDPRKLFEASLSSEGGLIADNFFAFGMGDNDANLSYILIHMNPPWDIHDLFV